LAEHGYRANLPEASRHWRAMMWSAAGFGSGCRDLFGLLKFAGWKQDLRQRASSIANRRGIRLSAASPCWLC
jgi:hypothetical protein